MKRLLLALPAVALLAACSAPATVTDGYKRTDFYTNKNHPYIGAQGHSYIAPGTWEAVAPTKRCTWDARNLQGSDTFQDQLHNGWRVVLGENYKLESIACGEWRQVDEENEL